MRAVMNAKKILLALSLATAAGSGAADCACLCVDGSYQTVCTAPEAVRAAGNVCQAQASKGCSVAADALEQEVYPAPQEGVDNCRAARVFDAVAGEHIVARVCDVLPDG